MDVEQTIDALVDLAHELRGRAYVTGEDGRRQAHAVVTEIISRSTELDQWYRELIGDNPDGPD